MPRPRKFDEREALAAAREQFWHQGYDGTSMADLSAATGVASQSLYGAFESKHDLFVRTLHEYCVEQVDGLARAFERMSSPWSWLMAAVTFEDGGRAELTPDGCYLSGSTAARSRLDADVLAESQKTYGRIRRLFVAAIAEGQSRGEIRGDVEADRVALAMVAAMQGIEFLCKSGLDAASFDAAKSSVAEGLRLAYAADTGSTPRTA
jgi:AcrR family transcriptional regulator